MPVQIRKGGAWQDPSGCRIFKDARWRNIVRIKIYSGGSWRTVANFTAPGSGASGDGGGGGGGTGGGSTGSMTLSVSPSSLSKSGHLTTLTTGSVVATPSGGRSPYTYAWVILSADAGPSFTINSPTLATTTVSASGLSLVGTYLCTIRCTVTDALGATDAAPNAICTFERTAPPVEES